MPSPRALLKRVLLRRAVARTDGQAEGYVRLLYTRPKASPERELVQRLLIVAALLGFVILVLWLDRGNLRDASDGEVSFIDVVYFAFVTVTTVGYGDIVPVGDRARLIDALLVTPIRIFIWFIFLGTAYQFVFQRIVEDLRMNALRESLQDHIVICGFGYSGRIAAREMTAQGHAADRIVIIDLAAERLEDAAAQGYVGLRGDATRDLVLREAGVAKAKAVLISVARDDTTVLAVLTARSINERARIIASVRDEENLALVRKAGADEVVAPSKIAGFLIADAVSSRYTTRFVSDILTTRGGQMCLVERAALPEEVGKRMREVEGRLVVAIERDGNIRGFWNSPAEQIREGDLVFAIEGRDREPAAG